jgi:hypothetical protein
MIASDNPLEASSLTTYQILLPKEQKFMKGTFRLTLSNDSTAPAIIIDDILPLTEAIESIGLQPPNPTLAVIGGVN